MRPMERNSAGLLRAPKNSMGLEAHSSGGAQTTAACSQPFVTITSGSDKVPFAQAVSQNSEEQKNRQANFIGQGIDN